MFTPLVLWPLDVLWALVTLSLVLLCGSQTTDIASIGTEWIAFRASSTCHRRFGSFMGSGPLGMVRSSPCFASDLPFPATGVKIYQMFLLDCFLGRAPRASVLKPILKPGCNSLQKELPKGSKRHVRPFLNTNQTGSQPLKLVNTGQAGNAQPNWVPASSLKQSSDIPSCYFSSFLLLLVRHLLLLVRHLVTTSKAPCY